MDSTPRAGVDRSGLEAVALAQLQESCKGASEVGRIGKYRAAGAIEFLGTIRFLVEKITKKNKSTKGNMSKKR